MSTYRLAFLWVAETVLHFVIDPLVLATRHLQLKHGQVISNRKVSITIDWHWTWDRFGNKVIEAHEYVPFGFRLGCWDSASFCDRSSFSCDSSSSTETWKGLLSLWSNKAMYGCTNYKASGAYLSIFAWAAVTGPHFPSVTHELQLQQRKVTEQVRFHWY